MPGSVEAARGHLARGGLDVAGALAAPAYDAIAGPPWRIEAVAPGARAVIVVGSGGRRLWERFRAAPEATLERDPLDAYCARLLAEAAALAGPGTRWALYGEQRGGEFPPLGRLAQLAGLGAPSRLGLLIHPRFGPWLALRALLYLPGTIGPGPGTIEADAARARPAPFDPCTGCPAPCATACHGGAVTSTGLDGVACARTRGALRACASDCDARLACVVGREHAYTAEQRAHHARASLAVLSPAAG
jgi:hypothetical protein